MQKMWHTAKILVYRLIKSIGRQLFETKEQTSSCKSKPTDIYKPTLSENAIEMKIRAEIY